MPEPNSETSESILTKFDLDDNEDITHMPKLEAIARMTASRQTN